MLHEGLTRLMVHEGRAAFWMRHDTGGSAWT